jgi:hypothetical protein
VSFAQLKRWTCPELIEGAGAISEVIKKEVHSICSRGDWRLGSELRSSFAECERALSPDRNLAKAFAYSSPDILVDGARGLGRFCFSLCFFTWPLALDQLEVAIAFGGDVLRDVGVEHRGLLHQCPVLRGKLARQAGPGATASRNDSARLRSRGTSLSIARSKEFAQSVGGITAGPRGQALSPPGKWLR